jgi:predicted NBD/HSP70 family sugar kinase
MPAADAPRAQNRARVVSALRQRGQASRGELMALTGLSRSTIAALVGELQRDGFVSLADGAGPPQGGRGRPAAQLRLARAAGVVVGLELGQHEVRAAVADLVLAVLAERAVSAELAEGERLLDVATGLVDDVLGEAGATRGCVVGAAIALPGPVATRGATLGGDGLVPAWLGALPPGRFEAIAGAPLLIGNDASLAAYGEHRLGAGRGCDDLMLVMLGDGIGAGLVLDGRPYFGAGGTAGEIGHVEVEPAGTVCRCGRRGCLGTVAGTRPLLAMLRPAFGDDLTVADMLALVRAGEEGPRRLVRDAGYAIGRVLAGVCNHTNPARIVVGGELAAAGDVLLEGIRVGIDRHALPSAAALAELVPAELGDRATVLGALSAAARVLGASTESHAVSA